MLELRSLVPFWNRTERTPARRDQVTDPFAAFRREVDRLFDEFFDGFGLRDGTELSTWSGATPRLDVRETDKEIVVAAELPGMDEKDFSVTLTGDVLTIAGEKKQEHEEMNGGRQYVERRYGSFSRSIRLPFEASDQDVSADFSKGVLTIRIAKPAEIQSKAKRIEVKAH